ncbi:MAG: M14 family metallopeptidase [bacterium]|nr:M14 family metallopeptidase [bacterium]
MLIFSKHKILLGGIVLAALMLGVAVYVFNNKPTVAPEPEPIVEVIPDPQVKIIGKSVQGRNIESYTYGKGGTHLVFVGGVHGGYEWNSVVLAYQMMDHLKANPDVMPANLKVTIIPSLNPDGVFAVIGKEGRFAAVDVPKRDHSAGRFNANNVDLNRNFDCNWKPTSTWRSKPVSAGTKVFSEPEAVAFRDFILVDEPTAVVFWHSQANTVYASECNQGIAEQTIDIMNAYAKAAKYSAAKTFDAYAITGDADGWLASINIPAITVELKTHETIEFQQNLAGVKALFEYYGK